MREFRSYGSVRGAPGNRRPYRDPSIHWIACQLACPVLGRLMSSYVLPSFGSRSSSARVDALRREISHPPFEDGARHAAARAACFLL
jgi:hypothetical protein